MAEQYHWSSHLGMYRERSTRTKFPVSWKPSLLPQNERLTMSGYIHSPEPTVQSWVQFNIWQNYVSFAACALQAYELALMSAEDMRFVRVRNNSISALLYLLNRLAAVAYAVSTGNEVLPAVTTLDTCTTINYAIGIAYALSLAVTACESFITCPLAQHTIHSEQWYL